MNQETFKNEMNPLADAAVLAPEQALTLNEVGLENVQSQVLVSGQLLPAKCQASVSLIDKTARGIHMSRLFKILARMHEQELSWPWLGACVEQMLATHKTLSDSARLSVHFELPVLRQALLSQEQGWRTYPVSFGYAEKKGKPQLTLTARVLYSSTCPCSAGLSQQAMQEQFLKDFKAETVNAAQVLEWLAKPQSLAATAHAQRSEALCEFTLAPDSTPSPLSLIDEMERALGTPVQAAVKREDEQEFARRNARNLMFCEDAARKLKAALLNRKDVADFKIEVRHFESLHPHDVVAKVQKYD